MTQGGTGLIQSKLVLENSGKHSIKILVQSIAGVFYLSVKPA